MSGEFRPEQNATVEATDDEALAKAYGLTSFNKATGQWELPRSDAGVRDGAEALAEGDAQHEAEHGQAPQGDAPAKPAAAKRSSSK